VGNAANLRRAVGFVVGSVVAFVILIVSLAAASLLSAPAVLVSYLASLVVGGALGGLVAVRLPGGTKTD
jgi:hypothetical protein